MENHASLGDVREIVIISAPRNGTNFFCECLGGIRQIEAYFELFNSNGVMGIGADHVLGHFRDILGKDFKTVREPELIKYFKRHPLEAIAHLRSAAQGNGHDIISYKIFPRQLEPKKLEAIVGRKETFVVFLSRRRLDVYISYLKAQQTNVWKNIPTHELELAVDVEEFLTWAKDQDRWFADCLDMVRRSNRPFITLDYNRDIDVGKEALIEHVIKTFDQVGVSLVAREEARRNSFRRQDIKAGPFKKVINGDELRAELRKRKKYNYALTSPLDQPATPK